MYKLRTLICTVFSTAILGMTALAGMPEMTPGGSGQWQAAFQYRLRQIGYPIEDVDGVYGEGTAQIIQQFQEASGLEVNGNMDAATIDALYLDTVDATLGSETYTVRIVPPFAAIGIDGEGNVSLQMDRVFGSIKAMENNGLEQGVQLVMQQYAKRGLDQSEQGIETVDEQFETSDIQVQGKDAALIKQTYIYTQEGVEMTLFKNFIVVPVSEADILLVTTGYEVPSDEAYLYNDGFFTEQIAVDVCENIRGGSFAEAPGLNEAQFELVAEDAQFVDVLPLIMKYVDAEDINSDAALYYGGKLAQLYRGFAGLEDPELRTSTIEMSAMLTAFDHPELNEESGVFGEKLYACKAALGREDAKEKLENMGIADLEDADIENISDEVMEAVLKGISESDAEGETGN